MRRNPAVVKITDEQRQELSRWAVSRTLPAADVFRARLILALADGKSYSQIMSWLQTTAPTISRRKQRFEQDGMDGLDPHHKGSQPRAWPMQRCKLASRARRCSSRPMETLTGRTAKWRKRWG